MFKYTKGLHKIRQMRTRIKVIPGGTSAGKTISILAILIDKCTRTPGLTVSVVSESMPHMRKGAMRDFLKIMKSTNRFVKTNWNITNSTYTFTNGAYIEFFGTETGLVGSRRNILYVNEANLITEEQYTQLAMRTDQDIYLDYNPTNKFWIENVIAEGAEVLTLTYKDNEALPQSVIDFLESKMELAKTNAYWENWCKVYLSGMTGNLEGVIYTNWSEIDTVPEDAELIGFGMDFGFTNDPSACVGVYRYDGELILDEVMYHKGLSNADISAHLKQEGVHGEIYADSADPKSISEIRKYGFRIYPVKKGPDSIKAGIQILQEYKMRVTKRSHNLKKELETYAWRKDKEGNTINEPIDYSNHICDGLRYLALMKLGKKPKASFGLEVLKY